MIHRKKYDEGFRIDIPSSKHCGLQFQCGYTPLRGKIAIVQNDECENCSWDTFICLRNKEGQLISNNEEVLYNLYNGIHKNALKVEYNSNRAIWGPHPDCADYDVLIVDLDKVPQEICNIELVHHIYEAIDENFRDDWKRHRRTSKNFAVRFYDSENLSKLGDILEKDKFDQHDNRTIFYESVDMYCFKSADLKREANGSWIICETKMEYSSIFAYFSTILKI